MNKTSATRTLPWLLATTALAVTAACSTSPTGRKQLMLFDDGQVAQMGVAAFQEMKQKVPPTRNAQTSAYVTCVANAITREVSPGQPWEVSVFEDKQVNAFALPGGKVGVYTGLLNVADTPDQLAAVVGHEIAHVVARHSNERLSASALSEVGAAGLMVALGASGMSDNKKQLMGMLGVTGIGLGGLWYSRAHETEADRIGLEYMARAGFDPRQSVTLWQDMARQGGAKPPEFISTHPSDQTRIENLNALLPGAIPTYDQARAAGKQPRCR